MGPPLATFVTGGTGSPAALVLIGVIATINVITALLLIRRRRDSVHAVSTTRPQLSEQLRGWSRWVTMGAFVLLQATNIATVTIGSLFVTRDLHSPLVWAGIILGAAALLEIPALIVIGRLHDRTTPRVLLLTGFTAGVLYYGAAVFVTQPWQLLVLQPLNAWFFAVVAGVGLTVFQEIFPSPGLASGLFTNTRRIGAVIAGLLIALTAAFPAPYRAVYGTAAVIAAAVALGAFCIAFRKKSPSPESPSRGSA